jgi:hypothetical protein
MKKLLLVFLISVVAAPASAKVFTYKKKNGQVVITDDFFQLPKDARAGLMADLEKEAQAKYSPTEIGMMKQSGDWPPLEMLRSLEKKDRPELKVDWSQMGKAAEKVRLRWTSEYSAYRNEKKHIENRLPSIDDEYAALEAQKLQAHAQDLAAGTVGRGMLEKLNRDQQDLLKEKEQLQTDSRGLSQKRRRINMGELVYTAPPEPAPAPAPVAKEPEPTQNQNSGGAPE